MSVWHRQAMLDASAKSKQQTPSVPPQSAPSAPVAQTIPPYPHLRDHAADFLDAEPTISDAQREAVWDSYYGSKSPDELAAQLQPMNLPANLHNSLVALKHASVPPTNPVEQAIQRMRTLDLQVLEIAESHPAVLKAFTADIG